MIRPDSEAIRKFSKAILSKVFMHLSYLDSISHTRKLTDNYL